MHRIFAGNFAPRLRFHRGTQPRRGGRLGKQPDWAVLDYDGAYGAQCVDLTCYYYEYLGQAIPWGNAADYVGGGSFTSGWPYQSSTESGDTGVDDSYWPGHVAIMTGVSGDQLTIVEQNFNDQPYCCTRQCAA